MDIELLKSTLDLLVKDPALQASLGQTFCNIGVHRIGRLFGVEDFPLDKNGDPPLANNMCEILAGSKNFERVTGETANTAALAGKFAIAAHAYIDAHGHVATVYPSPELYFSPSWKKEVPFVANIGKKNAVMPCSQAFPVNQFEPIYYQYLGEKQ